MAGMQSKFSFTRRGFFFNDITAVIDPDDNCAFGYMGQASGSPTYYFGAYEEGATATYAGDWDGEAHTFVFEANYQVTPADIRSFFTNCKTYIVNVEHKLTSDQFDTMVDGVINWMTTENITPYTAVMDFNNSGQGIPQFGNQGLEIEVMSGTKKLSDVGALFGFVNIGEVVQNIFIDAYMYSQAGTTDYNDSPYEFLAYDGVRLAVEAEYITDPDIIDFINDNSWVEILETRCDWTINIDGSKAPDITVMWDAPGITSGDLDADSATADLQILTYNAIGVGEWLNLGKFTYNKRVYKTSWKKLASEGNLPGIDRLLSNIPIVGEQIAQTNVGLRMCITYYREGGMSTTSYAKAYIDHGARTQGFIENPKDGSTIRFTRTSTDEAIELFMDEIDLDDLDDPTVTDPTLDQAFSGVGLLTKTYVLTKSRLQQLGRFLWTRDFFDYIEDLNASPIENIVSVKMVPFDIPCGSDTSIVLGNVDTGVYGKPVDIDYNCKHTIGTVTIQKKYPANCNFLNSNTFTKLTLFLPFIGFKEIDADVFLDKALKVEYINDIITGNCKAVIYADNIPICDFSGQIGLDVPISSTNRAQVEMGLISAVGQGIAQVASGNIGGAVSSALSIGSNSFHTETRGANSPSVDSFMTHDCFYILENAVVQYPSRYNHTHGRPLNLSKTLRNVTGFTVCEDVDVSGIQGATKEELDYIKDMLEKGVYL